MKRNIFFTILSLVFLYGCGYTSHSVLPSGEATVHVGNFVNKIDTTREISNDRVYFAYRPGLETDITRAVIDKFMIDGNYEIKDEKSAHFLLTGELVNFRREPLRYDASENVIEYRLHIAVDIKLYDLKKESIVWRENNFAGESTYRTTGQFAKSESAAITDAVKDLARRIVERTVLNW
ncbi:MAG: hypothetical protein HQ549_06940 [Candidatus Omnitrophica bacterium]|nr:hypothetical protein [Candidatus Omnitrophota bacterium]